jgi:integrase
MIAFIGDLKEDGRFGYAASFESTIRAIKEFHEDKVLDFNCKQKVVTRYDKYKGGKPLKFVDITSTWLKKFELHLQKHGKSRSTLGIYTRNIKVLFNYAVKHHEVKVPNPFKDFTPKSSEGHKIALTAYQISLIANYKTTHPQMMFYRDIFMFSFLGNGMNLSDIARLKFSNVVDGEILFVREKTKNKETKEEKLSVPISKNMQSIIDRHGNKVVGHDGFLFPILKPDWSEERKFAEVKQLVKQTNKYLKRIALAVGIKEHVSSYVARHSWASVSKNSGVSIEFISESMGHSSVLITKRYLKNFEKSTKVEHSEKMENQVYNSNAV